MPRDYKTIQTPAVIHERFREARKLAAERVGTSLSDAQFVEMLLKRWEESESE